MIVGTLGFSDYMFITEEDEQNISQVYHEDKKYFKYVDNNKQILTEEETKKVFTAKLLLPMAMVDLCKCDGHVANLIATSHNVSLHEVNQSLNHRGIFYDFTDGNKYVGLDKYSSPMFLIPAREALTVFETEYKTNKYRRYDMAIKLLKSIRKNFDHQFEIPYVLFFGY
jgi:hypothetical protein